MRSGAAAYRESLARGLEPEPWLTVTQWADAYRILSRRASSEPGPYHSERTPYLVEIQDALSPQDPAEFVVIMKGSQLGFTEVGNNWLGYNIDHHPGPILYVEPTLTLANRVSKQRVRPMLNESPRLAGKVRDHRLRDSGNTILAKEYAGGMLIITGANSATGLRSMPCRDLFFDEADGAPPDVDGEGDPLQLAITRTNTFRRNRKVFLPSTPAEEPSRIESWYLQGDQRHYLVPCPHCGVFQPITWAALQWDQVEGGHAPETVRMICEACSAPIYEHHKTDLLAAGYWQATAKAKDPRVRSYYLPAFYSPLGWLSWQDIVLDFIKAKREAARGDFEKLKSWTNTVEGVPWRETVDSGIDHGILYGRREAYAAPVPAGAVLLGAGADVQLDRIELEVVGFSPTFETWGIAYKILYGDPDRTEVWEQLDVELERLYLHEGGVKLGIAATFVDAGYKTSIVYEYCKARSSRRVWASMGKDGPGRELVSAPSRKRSGANRRPVQLFTLGVDNLKSLIYKRWRITEQGPGYAHFPISEDYDEEVFQQFVAEEAKTIRRKGATLVEWRKSRPRNEALDCRIMATAAVINLGDAALRAAARRMERFTRGSEASPEGALIEKSPGRRRRRGSSWATSWRKKM